MTHRWSPQWAVVAHAEALPLGQEAEGTVVGVEVEVGVEVLAALARLPLVLHAGQTSA